MSVATENDDAKLELYTLLTDGYKAMEKGRESSIEDVISRLKQRREN